MEGQPAVEFEKFGIGALTKDSFFAPGPRRCARIALSSFIAHCRRPVLGLLAADARSE